MSTAEIITVIKAINDHVTNKYCEAIVSYFNEKTNAHLLFERELFNQVDQAVQRLINDITGSLKPISSGRFQNSGIPKNILAQIQKHCNKYNQSKKNMYDSHLAKIKDFEKQFSQIIQQTFKEKVVHQNNLFDTALQTPVSPQNINHDIINLLALCQNAQSVQNNTQPEQAPANVNLSNSQNIPAIQAVQNALLTMNNIQPTSTTPTQTPSTPNTQMINNNTIDKMNQINQFLSIISDTVKTASTNANDITNINGTNTTFGAQNGDENVFTNTHNLINGMNGTNDGGGVANGAINQNNTNINNNGVTLSQNILNDIGINGISPSQNGISPSQNGNNVNNNPSQTNNTNNNNNSTTNTNIPSLLPLPLNSQPASNTQNEQNSIANDNDRLQVKNIISPIHYGNNRAILPIKPHNVPLLPAPPPKNASNSILNNSPANILPSFPNTNINCNADVVNTNANNANNANTLSHHKVTPQILDDEFVINRNSESKSNVSTVSHISNTSSLKQRISLAPTAPPKPPPPPKPSQYDDSPGNISTSNSEEDDDSIHGYECTLCNKMFDTPHQWNSHLRKSHLKTHRKKKKSKRKLINNQVKKSKHKKSKRKRKRAFTKMINENNNNTSSDGYNGNNNVNISNKRRRQIFQCELCSKQFSRLSSYCKHYNHHMVNNKNSMCIFCLNQFKNEKELKNHVDTFGAGMLLQDGYFQCCQCTMKFKTKNNLQSHINCVHMKKNKNSLEMFQLFSLCGMKKNGR